MFSDWPLPLSTLLYLYLILSFSLTLFSLSRSLSLSFSFSFHKIMMLFDLWNPRERFQATLMGNDQHMAILTSLLIHTHTHTPYLCHQQHILSSCCWNVQWAWGTMHELLYLLYPISKQLLSWHMIVIQIWFQLTEMTTSTHFHLHFIFNIIETERNYRFSLSFDCFFYSFPFLCCCFYFGSAFSSSSMY